MREEVKEIMDSWANRPAAGIVSSSDEGEALSQHDRDFRIRSRDFVNANPELFTDLEGKSLPECVESLEKLRDAGLDELSALVQIWIWRSFEFQNIGGEARTEVRVIGEGE